MTDPVPTPHGGSTVHGLPYPFPTDLVTYGADDIRALAEAADLLFASAVTTGTRAGDDLVALGAATPVVGAAFNGTSLIGKTVLALGTLRWQIMDAPSNVFIDLRMDGVAIGNVALAAQPHNGADVVTTFVGVGVATTAAPSVVLSVRADGSVIQVRTDSRVVAVGGFGALYRMPSTRPGPG